MLKKILRIGFWVLPGVALGTGLYTFIYAKGTSYLLNDPQACTNCHIMTPYYESWVKASHRKAATCNDCHVPHGFPAKYIAKARNGWNHGRAFTAQDFEEPLRITKANLADLQHNCVACHSTLTADIVGHRMTPGAEQRCTECHRSVGHLNLD